MSEDASRSCQGCGSQITNEQIANRQAGLVQGVLLCPDCVEEKRREAMEAQTSAQRAAVATENRAYIPTIQKDKEEEQPLTLVDDEQMQGKGEHMIRSFAEGSSLGGAHKDADWNRPLTGPTEAATRCRTFHGKLTDAGLANMDDIINEWLDSRPDLYIKSATSSIGTFEGKTKEPHVIITVFY